VQPFVVPVSVRARRAYDQYLTGQQRWGVTTRALAGFYNREPVYVLKFSILFALSRATKTSEFEISAEDMAHAVAFAAYLRSRAWPRISETAEVEGRSAERMMDLYKFVQRRQVAQAKENGTPWVMEVVHYRKIQHKAAKYGLDASRLRAILGSLVDGGYLLMRPGATTSKGGRPSGGEYWVDPVMWASEQRQGFEER
jgi:hypothetical protein